MAWFCRPTRFGFVRPLPLLIEAKVFFVGWAFMQYSKIREIITFVSKMKGDGKVGIGIVMTLLSLTVILIACSIFVNAVEWLGKKLNLHQGVVGSVFAAVGTALPETIIPVIAILFAAGQEADAIGIGAIAGAPFMLGTLAFFISGLAVIVYSRLGRRELTMDVDVDIFAKDLQFFIVIYGIAILTTFFNESIIVKTFVAIILLLAYIYYLRVIMAHDAKMVEECEPLYLSRFLNMPTSLGWIVFQLLLALTGISYGAYLFIGYVEDLSKILGIAPLILSMIITPIATELPEKLNSVMWIGKKKDTLALGNISGAMVFQSSFPVVFGILFTPWNLQGATMVSAALALSSALFNLLWIKTKKTVNPYVLMFSGIFYLAFIIYLFA